MSNDNLKKQYYNNNNVGIVNFTQGGGVDTPSALTSCEFDDYGRLKKIVIKDGVTSVPEYYQYYNKVLTYCSIPSSVTSIGTNAFTSVGRFNNFTPTLSVLFDVSDINLSNITPTTTFNNVFSAASLKGNLSIPNSLLSGATSGYSSVCISLFENAYAPNFNGDTFVLNVYANNSIIPRGMLYFSNSFNTGSEGLRLTIHGTPTFLSTKSICCSSGGTVTFIDCTTPPNAPAYDTSSTAAFYNFKGILYVPSSGLTAWKNKYKGIASQIQAIPT